MRHPERFIGLDIGTGGEDRRGRILTDVDEIVEVPSILLGFTDSSDHRA